MLIPSPASHDELLRARMTLMRYELLIQNNLHCMINSSSTIEECLDYYHERSLLRKGREAVLNDLSSRGANPLYRSYQYVYAVGCEFFWTAAERLSASGCEELVRFCFRGPSSPATLRLMASSLESR